MLLSFATLAVLAARLEFVVPDAGYSLRDGLPAVQVLSLHQDRYGALWAGTTAGLAQLGGPVIRVYGPDQGLARSAVFAIEEEPSGAIVVGTAGGIARLAGDRFEPVALPAAARELAVRRLVRTRDGTLWALAGDRTLLRQVGSQWQNVGIDGALAFEAQDFAIDETGVLWLATRSHGLLRLKPAGTRFQKAGEFTPGPGAGAIDHVAARAGRVYFTSARGLSMLTSTKDARDMKVKTWPFSGRDGIGHRAIAVGGDGRVGHATVEIPSVGTDRVRVRVARAGFAAPRIAPGGVGRAVGVRCRVESSRS